MTREAHRMSGTFGASQEVPPMSGATSGENGRQRSVGMLTVGSLFSGIGGLDLGLERAGMTVAWQSEIDPFACSVLAHHWPDVPNLGDVTTIDWKKVPRVDLICGGYPCQPFSVAGKRGGGDDHRHLWPHFAGALRHLRPRFALLENVPGHLSLGFGRVLGDLAELGYDAEWDCIPAAALGAPHLRYRVFVVAHANEHEHQDGPHAVGWSSSPVVPAHADGGELRQPAECVGRRGHPAVLADDGEEGAMGDAYGAPADALAEGRGPWSAVGESGWWATEPDVGRVAYGVPAGVDRLRALGNSVVPQVAEFVGRRILTERAA